MEEAYKIKTEKEESNEIKKGLKPNEFTLPEEPPQFNKPEQKTTSTKPMLNGNFSWNQKIKIDEISGKRATEHTPPELIKEKIYPQVHSILYYINKKNPLGDFPENPLNDPQFLNWERPVLDWVKKQDCENEICYNKELPQEYDDIHIPKNQPKVEITEPNKNDYIAKNSYITIKAKAKAPLGIKQLDFFFNEKLIGTDSKKPFYITFNPSSYINNNSTSTPQKNDFIIKVKAYDEVLNREEDKIKVKIKK